VRDAVLGEMQQDAGSLMRPAYDAKMTTFDEAWLASMRQGLAARRGEGDARDGGASPSAVLAARASTESTNESDAGAGDDVPSELSAADRDLWAQVKALMNNEDALAAWQAGQKRFVAYPSVYAVQDLRCKAAMGRLGS
jgi:hypothetical protein